MIRQFSEYVADREVEVLVLDIAEQLIRRGIPVEEFSRVVLATRRVLSEQEEPIDLSRDMEGPPGSPSGSRVKSPSWKDNLKTGFFGNLMSRIKKGWNTATAASPQQSFEKVLNVLQKLVSQLQSVETLDDTHKVYKTRELLANFLKTLNTPGGEMDVPNAVAIADQKMAQHAANGDDTQDTSGVFPKGQVPPAQKAAWQKAKRADPIVQTPATAPAAQAAPQVPTDPAAQAAPTPTVAPAWQAPPYKRSKFSL